jgi:hypothetical protein
MAELRRLLAQSAWPPLGEYLLSGVSSPRWSLPLGDHRLHDGHVPMGGTCLITSPCRRTRRT